MHRLTRFAWPGPVFRALPGIQLNAAAFATSCRGCNFTQKAESVIGPEDNHFENVAQKYIFPKEARHGRVRVRRRDGKFENAQGRFSASVVNPDSPEDLLRLLNAPTKKRDKNDSHEVELTDDMLEGGPAADRDLSSFQDLEVEEGLPVSCERLGIHGELFPWKLKKAVLRVLKPRNTGQYVRDGMHFSKFLYLRNIPWTEIIPDFVPEAFKPSPEAKRMRKMLEKGEEVPKFREMPWFNYTTPPRVHRTFVPVRYGEREAYAYMAGRMVGHYAATYRVLKEIQTRVPDFDPIHVLDFGSGLGTAVWASNQLWGRSLKEYVCVDSSSEMTDMAGQLLRQGDQNASPAFGNVFYRSFLPISSNVKYDVVIAAHSLSEMSCEKERRKVVERLWEKTNQFLVIVEHGFWPGFNIIREARRVVLGEKACVPNKRLLNFGTDTKEVRAAAADQEMTAEEVAMGLDVDPESLPPTKEVGHVFGPCPHDGPCPKERMIVKGTCHRPCNFSNNTQLSVSEFRNPKYAAGHHKERVSYVIFRKGERPENEQKYDRLLKPMQRRGSHCLALLCRSNGELEVNTFTKAKNREWYKAVRYSRWGDMIPHMEATHGRFVLSQAPKKHKYRKAGKSDQTAQAGEGDRFAEASEDDVDERSFLEEEEPEPAKLGGWQESSPSSFFETRS